VVERKCAGCGQVKNRDHLIKITKENSHGDIIINHSNKIFGRSVYLCYNKSCIEAAFKKNKISKVLRASVPEDLKGKLINEF
jgi:predicted RNA-binding protein YlxR (DUF448 family)